MKPFALFSLLFFLSAPVVVLADEPPEILLWPAGAPGSEGKTEKEMVERGTNGERKVWRIHHSSITPYLPSKEKANGAAVLVIPGGGHRLLAIDHEGYFVAQWLKDRGVAAFVLKHRLARETNSTYKIEEHSFQDTRRAMRLIRSKAGEWNIDPTRVGVMGFSAGGELASMVSIQFDPGNADAMNEIEKQSSRPAFQALIYPGNSKAILPRTNSPPAFLVCSYNDRADISEGLADVYLRFKKAGVPAELHIYSSGGHGFGLRERNQAPVGAWPTRFEEWLKDRGLLGKKP